MATANIGSNGKGKSFSKNCQRAREPIYSESANSQLNTSVLEPAVESHFWIKGWGLKKIVKCFLVLTIVAGIFICFNPMCYAAQLVFGLDTPPDRLIPIKIKNPQTFPVSMQIFQGLFDLNEQGKVIPTIVKSWESKDQKTWLFHIRKGIYFHDSKIFKNGTREVTAEDVFYSLTRFCSADAFSSFLLTDSIKGAKEYNQGKATQVSGLKILDKYTLEVELIQPERFFINRISTAWISVFPKEIEDEKFSNEIGLSMAVGTGPYKLISRSETEIVLKKNNRYWDKINQPRFEKIVYRVIKNDQIRLANLQRRNIDLMVLPNSLFASVLNKDGTLRDNFKNQYQIKSAATFNTHFLGINNKTISDENLRRAMFWGTNRQEIINYILYGYAEVTGGTVPPGINGYQPPFSKNLFDPEKAKSYLKKSSYKGENLELLVHDIDNSEQIGQIFQSQMTQIGIKITLKKQDFNSTINLMVKGESQLFSMFFEYVFSSPEPILMNFSSSKIPVPNFFHYSNPSVDGMLKSLYETKDEKESVRYCSKIEAKIMEDVPAIFLYRQKYVIIYPINMKGLELSGNNHYFLEKIRLK